MRIAVELTANNRRMLYGPEGVARGFVTLADDTEVSYQMPQPYDPACYRGVRWDDPAFSIVWPVPIMQMSELDGSIRILVLSRWHGRARVSVGLKMHQLMTELFPGCRSIGQCVRETLRVVRQRAATSIIKSEDAAG